MNVNKCKAKMISYILCLSVMSGNFLTVNASEAQPAKDNIGQTDILKSSDSNYSVIVPKTIILDESRQSDYSVTVTGDIPCSKRVFVSPVDGIGDTENLDFYMKDQASENGKSDVAATITQNKVYWNYEEVLNAYKETGSVNADNLSAGTWKGTFKIAINLLDDPNHEHQYTGKITKEPTCTEEGEKTYTCECGDSYAEKIPATGHSYTEKITKEPTCTEEGEKTHTCENCGDTYTEKIPATGHNFVDGECGHCGEKDPDYHHFVALNRKLSVINTSTNKDCRYGSASASGGNTSRMYFLIELPDWYEGYFPCDVSWYVNRPSTTYSASVSLGSGPTQGSSAYNSFSSSGRTSTSSTTNKQLKLYAGANYIYITASNVNNTSGTVRGTITFPDEIFLDRELCRSHICEECHYMEEHYSSETDSTKDEYYFCDECGQQFRHRCMFDGEALAVAQCIGGNIDLECIDDYYDKEHILFDTCGQTSSVYFEGLGHDWKPYVVELSPTFETTVNSSDSSYKFTEGAYGYTGTIGTAKYKSNGITGTLYIKLPDNFIGTYTLPISYNISSSSFTKTGYRMDVTCTNYYDYKDGEAMTSGKSKSYLNYSLAYASASVGTTNGTINVELHPGNNAIRFGASASVNLSTWSTYTGSVTFKTPVMPHSVFNGKEVHKCSRCNIEESHADTFREVERVDANCIEEGYVIYVCDDCGFTYMDILPIAPDNHKNGDIDDDGYCDDCGKQIRHIHNYTRTVTTEPTCTTDGLAVYTCNGDSFSEDCTDTYSETLNAYGHDFQPYIWSNGVGWHYMIYGSYWSQPESTSGYTLKCTYNTTSAHAQHSYSVVRIGITLPDDFEGTYTYRISYKAEGPSYGYASVLAEDVYLSENPWTETINASGSSSGSFSITCKAGTTYKYIGFANGYTNGSGIKTTATLTLIFPKLNIDYSSQYHKCSRCGLKEEHHISDGICNECGYEDAAAALMDVTYEDCSEESEYTEEHIEDDTEISTEELEEKVETESEDETAPDLEIEDTASQEETAIM